MIRLVKAGFGIGIIINAVNLANVGVYTNGVWGVTYQPALSNFMFFLIGYIIVDMVKDGLDNLTGGSV